MNSLPWHVGYFAEEGEMYEWEEDDDDLGDGIGKKIKDAFDEWKDYEDLRRTPQEVTSIAATPYGLAVIASLVADMQRQLGHLPKSSGAGLKPIYGPVPVPGGLLNQVVASSETQITQLQFVQNNHSQRPSPQSESQKGSTRTLFSAVWARKTEIVVATVATGALIYILPKGGGGGALPAFARVAGPLAALFIKTGRDAIAEAEFQESMVELGSPEAIGLYNV